MRIRIRALIAVCGIARRVLFVAAPAFAADDRYRAEVRERGGQGVLREARRAGGSDRRLPEGAVAAEAREQRDHLGLARVPGAVRRHVEVRRAGGQEHGEGPRGPHPQRPRGGRARARRGRGREGAVRTRRSPTPRNEAGRIIEEARQSAETVRARPHRPRRAGGARDPGAGAGRHRQPARRRRWRSCATKLRSCRSTSPAASSSATSTTTRTASSSTASSTRSAEQLSGDRPHRRVRAGAARDRAGRRPARRGRRRAVPLRADRRGQRRAADGARRTRACRPTGAPRSSTSCSRTRARTITRAMAAFIVGAGRGHDLPGDRRALRRARGADRASTSVAEVRSAVPLDDAQVQQLAEALARATGKHVEVKVIVDPTVMGGLVATIGDTVIDGTVRHRLEQLKETHANMAELTIDAERHRGGAAQERRGLPARRSTARRSAACSRSATASRASPGCRTRR